jgi:hypothetical protein
MSGNNLNTFVDSDDESGNIVNGKKLVPFFYLD